MTYGLPDISNRYGFFKGLQVCTLTLTLCTHTRVPMGLLKPLPITSYSMLKILGLTTVLILGSTIVLNVRINICAKYWD